MYKEIVTKAIIGKGKKSFKDNYTVLTDNNANTVLGCWVINHNFKGYETNGQVSINGSFDVNIWYSYDGDKKTSVATKKIEYGELINLKTKEGASLSGSDIIVKVLKQPTCSNVSIKDDVIEFQIDKELGIEAVNDEKVKIKIEESEDPWDLIEDQKEEVDKQIDNEVKEDFI